MSEYVQLTGYCYSVYTRIARITLYERGIEPAMVEFDPFSESASSGNARMLPFGRVPVLRHGDFELHETAAITRYIDAAFPGAPLMPAEPRSLARTIQVVSIIDNYGYWPLVRQVFSHAVFRPLQGEPSSLEVIAAGIEGSHQVLAAIESIAIEALVLDGEHMTLADFHLAPMIDYFAMSEEGRMVMLGYPHLSNWWERM